MARKVGRGKSKGKRGGIRKGRKPPLYIASDFGTNTNSPISKRIGNDRKIKFNKTSYAKK